MHVALPHLTREYLASVFAGIPGCEDCLEALAAEQPTEDQKERRERIGLRRPEAFDRKKRKRTRNYEEEM